MNNKKKDIFNVVSDFWTLMYVCKLLTNKGMSKSQTYPGPTLSGLQSEGERALYSMTIVLYGNVLMQVPVIVHRNSLSLRGQCS